MRIVFMGTPDYATQILKALLTCKDISLTLLVTQPDKPVGRKQVLTPPHTKAWVLENDIKIDIFQPNSLKTQEAYTKIADYKPDFIVVAAYGKILPREILDIAPCINLHASLLPKYRGASPIQSSILNNDSYAGVTAMLMEEGLDSGDILGLSYVKLDSHVKVDTLFDILAKLAAKLTIKTLKNFDILLAFKQKEIDVSYAKKISKEDGLVDFTKQSALEIYTKFRAFDPWPGIFLDSGLKLKEMQLGVEESSQKAGTIVQIKEEIILTCKEGTLRIKSVQPASKKQMSAIEYARGKRLEVGNTLV